jgi:hypothetical protein
MNPENATVGCSTCVNVRPFVNVAIVGNVFSPLIVTANGFSDDVTVMDLRRHLRSDFTIH